MRGPVPTSQLGRRRLFCAAGSATVALLAGCSGLLPGGSDSDPDAGTDSYGIYLENALNESHTVHLEVSKAFEDEAIFEETVEIEGKDSREWEEVITENEEWGVSAELENVHSIDRWDSDGLWITPGSEEAPAVENVRVVVDSEMLGDERMPAVEVSTDRG